MTLANILYFIIWRYKKKIIIMWKRKWNHVKKAVADDLHLLTNLIPMEVEIVHTSNKSRGFISLLIWHSGIQVCVNPQFSQE